MHSATIRLTTFAALIVLLSTAGCGGGGGNGGGGSPGPGPLFAVTHAVAVLGRAGGPSGVFPVAGVVPSGLTASNYVPVAIRITAQTAGGSGDQVVEYHVYRPDYVATPVTDGYGSIPIWAVGSTNSLTFYDDGSAKSFSATKTSTLNPKGLITVSLGPSLDINAGTAIGVGLVGTRYAYSVEALYHDAATQFFLTPTVSTNYITYLQPVDLQASDFTGPNTSQIALNIPATLAADDYVLQASTSSTFTVAKTYKPYSAAVIQTLSATQANPREGAIFSFFNPATGWNAAADFPVNGTTIYTRVGVRDSRNGTDASTNPYLYSDPVVMPIQLFVGGPPGPP